MYFVNTVVFWNAGTGTLMCELWGCCMSSCGNMSKHLFTPDRAPAIDQNHSTIVHCSVCWTNEFLGLLRSMGEDLLRGRWMSQRLLHHWKAHSNMGDNFRRLCSWSSLLIAQLLESILPQLLLILPCGKSLGNVCFGWFLRLVNFFLSIISFIYFLSLKPPSRMECFHLEKSYYITQGYNYPHNRLRSVLSMIIS